MSLLFEKRGRRYYPVNDLSALDGLSEGDWLVSCNARGNWTTICRLVKPAHAEVTAAARVAREAMFAAMTKACEQRPDKSRITTAQERKAWRAYCDVMGGAPVTIHFEGISIMSVVDSGIAALIEEAAK